MAAGAEQRKKEQRALRRDAPWHITEGLAGRFSYTKKQSGRAEADAVIGQRQEAVVGLRRPLRALS